MRWKLMRSSSKFSRLPSSDRDIPMAMKNSGNSPLNVNEEYKKSLRSKSFLDMWSKVHDQNLRRTVAAASSSSGDHGGSCVAQAGAESPSSTPPPPPLSCGTKRLPEFLLEPSQESVVAATAAAAIGDRSASRLRVRRLFLEFFDVTFQACAACAEILTSIGCARLHHQLIRRLLLELSAATCFDDEDGDCPTVEFDRLASLLDGAENPLRARNLADFHVVQSAYGFLMQRLKRARRRILRRARLVRAARRATNAAVVAACGIAVAVVVAIAVHTVIGLGVVAAAAGPVAMGTAAARPRVAMRQERAAGKAQLDRLAAQVDTAAKGVYIVGREFDTMSRLVQRAHDELEHERHVARMVATGRGLPQLVREAAREVESGAAGMVEQLEEMEEHVHLCLITINKSRKMVAEVLIGQQQD